MNSLRCIIIELLLFLVAKMDREYFTNLRFADGIFVHSDNSKEIEVIINVLNVVSMNINGDYSLYMWRV